MLYRTLPTDGLQHGWTAVRGDDCATLVRQNLCPWSGDIWGKCKQIDLIQNCDNLDLVCILSEKFTLSFSVNFQGLIGEINNFF